MTTQPGMPGRMSASALQLNNPRSLAVYDTYDDAQRAVDYLSDHGFAVQNVMIVGTDLKQVERVTGRMTWGKAIGTGALSGMWMGLMVGLIMSFFVQGSTWPTILSAVVAGAVFFAIWAAIGYAFTQGKRDFTSISQVIATRYEILVESSTFGQANGILRGPATRDEGTPAPDERAHEPREPYRPDAPQHPGASDPVVDREPRHDG
ncbi:general stress protein [Mobilicoccus massiliensis]|uniref:general stress protein n=1 Tax=Mobilicoccus massiliensis TaxID=1522310 RepID=UPI001FE3C737|nr:general stress protein [Mobilicoccus massiliensis]